jgi:hypothetical protein
VLCAWSNPMAIICSTSAGAADIAAEGGEGKGETKGRRRKRGGRAGRRLGLERHAQGGAQAKWQRAK